jgi:hypothetical protein
MAMRNYFGHHPWMAAPLFLLGLALSLFMVLRPPLTSVAQPIAAVMGRRYLSWAAAFAFGLVVLLFYREHQSRLLSLVSMVRSHSARTDDIVVVRDLDTNTVELAPRLSEVLDRWLVIVDDLPDAAHPVPASFLLSTAPVPGNWPLAARGTNDPLQSLPLLHEPLDWFSKNIARRAPGDRINAAETYYLYRVPSNLMAPAYHAEHERSLFPEKP